jgi:hypothetical protein
MVRGRWALEGPRPDDIDDFQRRYNEVAVG